MIELFKRLQRMITKEAALEPVDDSMWQKRLEWLEDNAPEQLEDYLQSPRRLKKHLDETVFRAWSAIYSMTEERGMPRHEAREIALTDIIYPEVNEPDRPTPELPPETQKKLQRFLEKHLGH